MNALLASVLDRYCLIILGSTSASHTCATGAWMVIDCLAVKVLFVLIHV